MSSSELPPDFDDDDGDDPRARRTRDGELPARDNWERFAIIARPATAILGALVVGALGYFADQTIEAGQREATVRVEKAESYRLYTELMSRREESESLLRQEMFKAVLNEFFGGSGDTSNLSRAMLKLEMLALNFGESLSLSPLFVELDKQIEAMGIEPTDPFWQVKQDHFRHRLHSLARRVSSWQLSTLGAGGVIFEFEADLRKIKRGYQFPQDEAAENLALELEWFPDWGPEEQKTFISKNIDDRRLRTLKGILRDYYLYLTNVDPERRTVDVLLRIQDIEAAEGALSAEHAESFPGKPIEMSFELNFYNFPMIDNTRLIGDQRFALVMTGFDDEGVSLAGVVFPGSYASHRDRPFLTDVLERLRDESRGQPLGDPAFLGIEGESDAQGE